MQKNALILIIITIALMTNNILFLIHGMKDAFKLLQEMIFLENIITPIKICIILLDMLN